MSGYLSIVLCVARRRKRELQKFGFECEGGKEEEDGIIGKERGGASWVANLPSIINSMSFAFVHFLEYNKNVREKEKTLKKLSDVRM